MATRLPTPLSLLVSALVLQACASGPAPRATPAAPEAAAPVAPVAPEGLDSLVPRLLREHHVAGAGVAVVRGGRVAWSGYYGEQAPGVPITPRTVFNTASVEKTITAETLIALAAKGLISLDEPIHPYVSHPDLAGDPRYRLLTPRILLSHRSGLLNWPYAYEDGRLAFVHDPGTTFSYSGIGIELAAEFAERKLGQDFETLAFEHVLTPMGVTEMSMGRWKPWMAGRLATPMDAKGAYLDPREPPYVAPAPGAEPRWSAADDLLTTVDAYASFLAKVTRSTWLTPDQARERTAVLTTLAGDAVWACADGPEVTCARRYGHGLGWMVYEFDGRTVVKHGGNDQGENALVYFSPETGDGAVIFVNGGNGIFVTVPILDQLGDSPEIAAYYRQLVERHYGVKLVRAGG